MFKIIMVGSPGVGKTSFLRYCRDIKSFFFDNYDFIGVNLYLLNIDINENIKVKIQFWNINGRDNFRHIYQFHYHCAKACLLFFDLSDRSSFIELPQWIDIVKNRCGDIPIVLIGTKSDAIPSVNYEEVVTLVNNYRLDGFYFVSVLFGFEIEKIFTNLATLLIQRFGIKQGEDFSLKELRISENLYNIRKVYKNEPLTLEQIDMFLIPEKSYFQRLPLYYNQYGSRSRWRFFLNSLKKKREINTMKI